MTAKRCDHTVHCRHLMRLQAAHTETHHQIKLTGLYTSDGGVTLSSNCVCSFLQACSATCRTRSSCSALNAAGSSSFHTALPECRGILVIGGDVFIDALSSSSQCCALQPTICLVL